ncbi:hypothetical protein D3C85_1625540 [compost metagenome]
MLLHKIAGCHINLPSAVTEFTDQPLNAFIRRFFFLGEKHLHFPLHKRPSQSRHTVSIEYGNDAQPGKRLIICQHIQQPVPRSLHS